MRVRIAAGKFGGRFIEGSTTKRTHPMSEKIRNGLFNKIAQELPGARVLDAFAGSGGLGLEALSRGAEHVTFIEKDRVAQKVIAENIALLGVEDQAKLVRASVAAWRDTQDENEKYDIIFVDPPYYDPQLSTAMSLSGLLRPKGLMILSYPGRSEVPTELGVVVVDNRSYGTAALAFYRLEDEQKAPE